MQTPPNLRREILVFLLLTLATSAIFWTIIVGRGGLEHSGALVVGLMWCPGVAGLATQLWFRRTLRGLGWGWGRTRYQLAAWALPLGYAAVAYGVVWATGLGRFWDPAYAERLVDGLGDRYGLAGLSEPGAIGVYLLLVATQGVLLGCVSALGEETGWRGFLVPRLAELGGFTRASVLSGLIWAAWHWPLILLADYRGPSGAVSVVTFTVMVVAVSFPFAWLRLASGSLWTATLLHASHNAFIQGFFDRVTGDTGPTAWLIGEFGVAVPVVTVAVAWWFWRRRGRLAG